MVKLNKHLDPSQTGGVAAKLRSDLQKLVVGQPDAIDQVVNIYQTYLAGMAPVGRPIGSFLFLGPTGTGKTRLVEAVAESVLGDMRSVVKIDCGEFQHGHEIAKLIGSPPGYLGHRETHAMLSQEVLNQYHTDRVKISFVLFDEIEKASDALWNLLLGILDKATLTLGDNRRVDFSKAMIFMTSNLGAKEMSAATKPGLGFITSTLEQAESRMDAEMDQKLAKVGTDAARRKFTPEFINRLDKTVVFRQLRRKELELVLGIELSRLQDRIFSIEEPFIFTVTEDVRNYLLKDGTDQRYGARHLKRTIERVLVQPLSNLVTSSQIHGGDMLCISLGEDGQLAFIKEMEGMPAYAMVQFRDDGRLPDESEGISLAA